MNKNEMNPLNAQPDRSLNMPPIKEELVVKQALANYCERASLQVVQPNMEFHLEDRKLFICQFIVNDAIHIVVSNYLRNLEL